MTSLVERLTLPFDEDFGRYDLLSNRILGSFDIAAVNLACASELPGSDKIDMEDDLALLDEIASHVDSEIKRNYHRFLRESGKYNHSQAQWCALMMITVIQQDFSVTYNFERIRDPDFTDSNDLFIHGMLPGKGGDGGTCASIPVLLTAIGRRLGWPVRLATTRSHVFCRWDDPKGTHPFGAERFNIEGATLMGGHIYDDGHYLTWPEPLPPGSVEEGIYLRSLTPREELAMFLSNRGHCLFDNGKLVQAREAYAWAYRLVPHDPHYESFFIHAHHEMQFRFEERVLREYYGCDSPLPFGAHPPHVLHEMQADMLFATAQLGHLAHMPASARRVHDAHQQNRRQLLERQRKHWELTNHRGQMHVPPHLRRPHEQGYQPPPGFPEERTQDTVPGLAVAFQPAKATPAITCDSVFGVTPETGMLTNQQTCVLSAGLLEADGSTEARIELRRRQGFAADHFRHNPAPKALTAPSRINLIPPNKSKLRRLSQQTQRQQ